MYASGTKLIGALIEVDARAASTLDNVANNPDDYSSCAGITKLALDSFSYEAAVEALMVGASYWKIAQKVAEILNKQSDQ